MANDKKDGSSLKNKLLSNAITPLSKIAPDTSKNAQNSIKSDLSKEDSTSKLEKLTSSEENSTKQVDTLGDKKDGLQVPEPHTEVIKPTIKPIEVNPPKEVRPVAKDPRGMFDYSNCKQYIVKDGDTLLSIANKFLVGYEKLRYFNHISKQRTKLRPGKVIYIPNR